MRSIAVAVLALLLPAATQPASACGQDTPCFVREGAYLARTPETWDERSPLPVLLWFHGHRESAATTMADVGLRDAVSAAGALFVAMDGEGGSWSYPGKLTGARDDFAYVAAVLADLETRFPLKGEARIAAGFSIGASMVWHVACRFGPMFDAYVAVAGAWWDPAPVSCPGGPVPLLHIHGEADGTVPMAGRALRGGLFRQGNVEDAWRGLLVRNACPPRPDGRRSAHGLVCDVWSAEACASGREARFCRHPGGHSFEAQWIADALDWARGLSRRSAGR